MLIFTDEFYPADTGGSLYDGRKQVLYWADVSNEIAIVVPSPDTYQTTSRRRSLDSPGGKAVNFIQLVKEHEIVQLRLQDYQDALITTWQQINIYI